MNLRGDARILVTVGLGVLVAIAADPHQCLSEDCECEAESDAVYGEQDWRTTDSPSFGFDSDGDLRRVSGDGSFYGPAIEHRDGAVDELLAAWATRPVTVFWSRKRRHEAGDDRRNCRRWGCLTPR